MSTPDSGSRLPREALLLGSRDPGALSQLILLAEQALKTWEPVWSDFLPAAVLEEGSARLAALSELELAADCGYPQAERCRLRLQRVDLPSTTGAFEDHPLRGLQVSGNFLFDPATPADFRLGLQAAGASEADLGDLWVRGDRGAQLVITQQLADRWHGHQAQVRTVPVELEAIPLHDLQPPARPLPRQLQTVEASLRLDAVASAGFGVSRSRMAGWIRQGLVRVNWRVISSPSRDLSVGDRVQLDNRGELTVLEVEATKRSRWRLTLSRH
ncbi:photosystem II S4 domain protein [Synechococcus sp. CS-1324]|uniref:photosystem II S4 domain protein n=1 Tax=Synechococcus sp. CS-1324 TaxID=2847980 RepID=UPI000DB7801D|nr:photosystem II S4 domain protein [Synechococcus sp. CS-1324]MCT0230621.1 photosystem II S4 domain protein [Synechococcus sp. CS-1324]PZV05722.1 MAG: photosystem II S4 domain protein [Cyanobium sp.]